MHEVSSSRRLGDIPAREVEEHGGHGVDSPLHFIEGRGGGSDGGLSRHGTYSATSLTELAAVVLQSYYDARTDQGT
jgi:hypothetical protein